MTVSHNTVSISRMLHTRLISNSIALVLYHVRVKGSVLSIVNSRSSLGLKEGRMVSENNSKLYIVIYV